MTTTLIILYLVLLGAATIPVTWGPIQYGLRSPWRASSTGQALFWTLVSLALAIDLSAVFTLMDVSEGPAPLALAVIAMGLVNWTAWRMVATIRDAQRCDRDPECDDQPDSLPNNRSPEQETRHP